MSLQAYLARHAQMLVGSLGRIAQQPFAAFMTMAVIAVALALPLFLYLFLQNARLLSERWNDAFELSVYLDKAAGSSRAQSLAKQLRQRTDVAAVRVITAEEALTEFRQDSGFGKALDDLGENPLPDTLLVTPTLASSSAQGTDTLKTAIAAMPGVQLVQLDTQWVKKLQAILAVARRALLLIALLLGAGIILIVSNTIRLDISNRRSEIEVMKLVGASNAFTRRPFLYSGVWYGLGGGVLALALAGAAGVLLASPVRTVAALYGSDFRLGGVNFAGAAAVLCSAVALAWMGSWLAASLHIRAIEPT